MPIDSRTLAKTISRRGVLGTAAAFAATPTFADSAIGPSAHAPEFQRQNHDFAAAAKAAGKPVELVEARNYGPNGRAALRLMKLA